MFFAALFLARDQKVDLEQQNDDIKIILMDIQPEEKMNECLMEIRIGDSQYGKS